jgi:hypothetical protein
MRTSRWIFAAFCAEAWREAYRPRRNRVNAKRRRASFAGGREWTLSRDGSEQRRAVAGIDRNLDQAGRAETA